MTEIRYRPGKWFGIVSEHGVALLPDVLDEDAVKQVWSSFAEGRGLAGVLETLTGAFGVGLMSLPPFAVVALDGELARIAVRGDLLVSVVEDLDESVPPGIVSGEGVTTWSERMIAAPVSISVRQKANRRGSALSLPISSGVVLCSQLTSTYRGAIVEADQGETGEIEPLAVVVDEADEAPVAAAAPAIAEPVAPVIAAVPESAVPNPAPTPPPAQPVDDLDEWGYPRAEPEAVAAVSAAAPGPEPRPAPALEPEPESAAIEEPAPIPAPIPAAISVATPVVQPELTRHPDATMATEHTRFPAAETVRTPEDEYDHLFGATEVRVVEDAAVRAAPDDGLLISGVPGAVAAPSAPPTPAPEDDGDHDGHTISVAEMRALQASAPVAPAPRAGTIAVLELSTGDVIELDRPVIIGRRPATGRAAAGQLPQLVTVPSPMQDISRSHLDVRAEGIHVVARDLGTVNGTVLRRVGQAPVRLNGSAPVLVVGGDVLDLGDGVTVTIRELS
ncbi:FHA domain-containing protein [Microbacteriaceae bacterium VKM Ac-2854]|nr:FHA domain-containing protein [Microbacteriaceae bacterium VKM Ac-2854]